MINTPLINQSQRMDFFICKVIKFLPQIFGNSFWRNRFPLNCASYSLWFFWFDVRWQKYLMPFLKVWAKKLLLLGSLTDIHCFDAFCLHGASKIVLIVQFGNQLRHYWPNKKGFLDISLFFIYSYWYLPLKEWHTTCKKEKKIQKTPKRYLNEAFCCYFLCIKKT